MFADDAGRAKRCLAAGIAVSLAVHALVLTMQRHAPQREVAAPPRPIAVRLRPPPPPPPVPRVEEAAPAPSTPAARPLQRTKRARPRSVIAVDRTPAPAQPDPFTVQQAPEPVSEPEPPHFDREAARRMARSLANIRDPAKEGTAIGQFPDKPLETETRAARAIGAAKRRDCKDGLPGGLLGPLLILADKKDSGCKW
jgi:type IV secretory pathway VirB10-like protein